MSPFVEGVRDLLPGEIRERRWVYQELREFLARSGYQEVATPTLESLELYSGVEGMLLPEEMLKVVDDNGQILVLRPDLTLPIARLVATRYHKTPGPWKFSYIATAYQANGGQSHILREKTQAGVELLGRADLWAEVEVIGLLIQALQQVGIAEPMIDLGQTALVEEVFACLSLDADQKAELRVLMEEKNGQEMDRALTRWGLEVGPERELILELPRIFGRPVEVLARLRNLPLSAAGLQIVAELEEIYQALAAIGLGQYLTFDPAMVTQLGYYTGTIFRAYVQGFGEVVASGGRYDGLAERFGSDVPAIGFAIEIEKLLGCLRQSDQASQAQELRLVINVKEPRQFVSGYQLANLLKAEGISAEIYYSGLPAENSDQPETSVNQAQPDGLAKYCRFHQIPLIGTWESETESWRIVDQGGTEQLRLSGEVSQSIQQLMRLFSART